ncbi:MAG: hypothetical protein LBL26_05590, partial [Peptococcaceae bacterium]|nr:hypothetical protein [Peptococcaceae bacterium]
MSLFYIILAVSAIPIDGEILESIVQMNYNTRVRFDFRGWLYYNRAYCCNAIHIVEAERRGRGFAGGSVAA